VLFRIVAGVRLISRTLLICRTSLRRRLQPQRVLSINDFHWTGAFFKKRCERATADLGHFS